MNNTSTRHTGTTLATATAATALAFIAAVTPTAASADRADLGTGVAARGAGSVASVDIAWQVEYRKGRLAQYYVDHARELLQLSAR